MGPASIVCFVFTDGFLFWQVVPGKQVIGVPLFKKKHDGAKVFFSCQVKADINRFSSKFVDIKGGISAGVKVNHIKVGRRRV